MRAYHFISEKYVLNVVSDQRLKVSMLDDLNDPYELNAVDLPDRESREKANNFKNYMAEQYCILCFSKAWSNPLLWSHYANRHKGAAIEFEIEDSKAHPIKYRKNRYVLNSGKPYQPNYRHDKKDTEGIWLSKFKDWSYEEEISASHCLRQRFIIKQLKFTDKIDQIEQKAGSNKIRHLA